MKQNWSWLDNGWVWLWIGLAIDGTTIAAIRQQSIGNGQNFGWWYVLDRIRHITGCDFWKLLFRAHRNVNRNETYHFCDWIPSIGERPKMTRHFPFHFTSFSFRIISGELAIPNIWNMSVAFDYLAFFERHCCWRRSNLRVSLFGRNSR